MKSPIVSLARKSIAHYLKTGQSLPSSDSFCKKIAGQRAGVFVSLYEKNDSLRGCIGTFMPTKKNIAEEIIANAIIAATADPRFPPVTLKELPDLKISVDVLSLPKPIKKNFKLGDPLPKILNPEKYGLIISAGDGRRGLLLPNISGVETAEEQIKICYRKAGIFSKEAVSLETFTVQRHK